MMVARFIVFALLLIGNYSYASPLRAATVFVVPIFVQDLDEPRAKMDEEEPMYALSDDSVDLAGIRAANTLDIEKRSAGNAYNDDDNDDDLETAAGTNVLRPLFVYRQQVAYRQRAREAIRRGRRI